MAQFSDINEQLCVTKCHIPCPNCVYLCVQQNHLSQTEIDKSHISNTSCPETIKLMRSVKKWLWMWSGERGYLTVFLLTAAAPVWHKLIVKLFRSEIFTQQSIFNMDVRLYGQKFMSAQNIPWQCKACVQICRVWFNFTIITTAN